MTGMGEDVYEDRPSVLDALTEESQRMGMYGDAPDVEKMVEEAALAFADSCGFPRDPDDVLHIRASLESLGIPLSVLAAIKSGWWKAVPVHADSAMVLAADNWNATTAQSIQAAIAAAPKTPEDAR